MTGISTALLTRPALLGLEQSIIINGLCNTDSATFSHPADWKSPTLSEQSVEGWMQTVEVRGAIEAFSLCFCESYTQLLLSLLAVAACLWRQCGSNMTVSGKRMSGPPVKRTDRPTGSGSSAALPSQRCQLCLWCLWW